MGARMYFSESSRRDMQVSQEEFDRRWDLAFGKSPVGGIDAPNSVSVAGGDNIYADCLGCNRRCLFIKNENTVSVACQPSSKIEYVGFCSIKRGYVFIVRSKLSGLHVNVFYGDYAKYVTGSGERHNKYLELKKLLDQDISSRKITKKAKCISKN